MLGFTSTVPSQLLIWACTVAIPERRTDNAIAKMIDACEEILDADAAGKTPLAGSLDRVPWKGRKRGGMATGRAFSEVTGQDRSDLVEYPDGLHE